MATRAAHMVTIVASAVLLAGCAQAPSLPPGPTQAEVEAIVDQQNREWWASIEPDEPMPVIEPVAYLAPGDDGTQITDCIINAQLPGIMTEEDTFFGNISPEAQDEFERVQFRCSMMYPYDISDPEKMGYVSEAQLDYLYGYFARRLTPCIELMGYRVQTMPSRDTFMSTGYVQWVPYWAMQPQPQTAEEWERIDLRCPPPPIGEYWRPGMDYPVG